MGTHRRSRRSAPAPQTPQRAPVAVSNAARVDATTTGAIQETPTLDAMSDELARAAAAPPMGGGGGNGAGSAGQPAPPPDGIRLADDAAPEERLTLRGGTHRFGALMHIAESGDYGDGGLSESTVVTDDGRTLGEVYALYRGGRIGSENDRWEGHVAEELVASIRARGFVDSEEAASTSGLDQQVGAGRGEFHRLRLVPSDEVQADTDIDGRLDRERGFRDFIVNGHRRESRDERRTRGQRETFLEQFASDDAGGWQRHDGAPVSADDEERLRQELPRNARGRAILSGAALEAYESYLANSSNPPLDPSAWARRELARRPVQATGPAQASHGAPTPDSPSAPRSDERAAVPTRPTVRVGTPAADSPSEEDPEPAVVARPTRRVGTPSWAEDLDDGQAPDSSDAEASAVGVLPAPVEVQGPPSVVASRIVPVGEDPAVAQARFEEEQRVRWARTNLPDSWDEARRQHREEERTAAPEASPDLDAVEQREVDAMRGRATVGRTGVERESLSDPRSQRVDRRGRGVQRRDRGQLTVGEGGLQGEAGSQWERHERDGTTTQTRAHATANLADRSVGGQLTRESGPEGARRTASAGGDVRFDDHGVAGGNASLSGGSRGRTFTLSGGFTVRIEEPVGPVDLDGRYRVSGTRTVSVSLGGAASGGRGGGGITGRNATTRRFSRHFATPDEARRWYETADANVISRMSEDSWDTPASADEAAALAVGDSRSQSDTNGITASGNVNAGPYRIGLSVGLSETHEVVVTRSDQEHVRVTIRRRSERSAGATGGAFGMSAGLSATTAALEGAIFEYDVSEAADPSGRPALDRLLRHSPPQIPSGDRGPGWQMVERSSGSSAGRQATGDVLIGSLNASASTTDEDVRDADGTFRRHAGERSLSATTILPEAVTEGTIWADSSESFQVETDTRGGGARFSYNIDGANAQETNQRLAEAAGTEFNEVSGTDSGRWSVASSMSEADLRRFVDAVRAGRWNPGLVGAAFVPTASRLRERIRGCSSMDEARVAVRDFMVATEERGMALVRQVLGEGSLPVDVSLANSDVWQGSAGRARMQLRIRTIREQMREDPAEARTEIDAAYAEQQRRLSAMRDPERFTDLPRALRRQEIASNEPILAELADLRREVAETRRTQREEDAGGPVSREAMAPEVRRLHDALTADTARLETTYRSALAAYRACRRERALHEQPQRFNHTRGTVRQAHGSWEHYTCADRHWASAQRQWVDGDSFRNPFDTGRRELPSSAGSDEIQGLRRLSWQAHDKYAAALEGFRNCGAALRRVRADVAQRGDTQQFFGTIDYQGPE